MSTRRPTIVRCRPHGGRLAVDGVGRLQRADRRVGRHAPARAHAAGALGYTGPDPARGVSAAGRSGIVGVVFDAPLSSAFLDPVTTPGHGRAHRGRGRLVRRRGAAAAGNPRTPLADAQPTLTTAPIDAAVLIGCSTVMRESLADVTRARNIPVVVIEGDAGEGVPQIRSTTARPSGRPPVICGPRATARRDRDAAGRAGWEPRDGWGPPRRRGSASTSPAIGWPERRDVYPDAPAFAAAASSIDEGSRRARDLRRTRPRPTAVIAQSDLLAAGVIRAAEEAGLRVPDDVSVTGFDGVVVDGLARYALTTLIQPATEKGRAAGVAVAAMLEGREPRRRCGFTCVFREGNTTASVA